MHSLCVLRSRGGVCVYVCVSACECLIIQRTKARKCRLMTGHRLVTRHIKGTVHSDGLSFTVLLVPDTTTLSTRQSHPERLCLTHTDFLSPGLRSCHSLSSCLLFLLALKSAHKVFRDTAPKHISLST